MPASDLGRRYAEQHRAAAGPRSNGTACAVRRRTLPHFNEVDECAGLDGLLTYRVHRAMDQPPENTLHDLRWGDVDASGTTDEYVWVFLISGSVPPAHFAGGWQGASSERQPPMYFPNGGGTLKGISKPGEIVWSRIFIENARLKMDLGRAKAIELPAVETAAALAGDDAPMADHARRDLWREPRSDDGSTTRATTSRSPMPIATGTPTKRCWPRRRRPLRWGWRSVICGTRKNGKAWD